MKRLLLAMPAMAVAAGWAHGQPAPQSPAGDKPAFEVASVKPNRSDGRPASNFPLGPGDVYVPNGGFFAATNQTLVVYIAFAYKLMFNDMEYLLPQLPDWVTTDRFDIQARAEGNPTKDEMRLMMRSLLADRFKLAIHNETRQVPVFALVLVKPGKTGPQLKAHPADSTCSTAPTPTPDSGSEPAPSPIVPGGLPTICGGILGLPPSAPGRLRAGGRNVTMGLIANYLTRPGHLGRPVSDKTGLNGTFDFSLEWAPELNDPLTPGADLRPEQSGALFQEALKEQLGLKLESQKGPVDMLVVDHVEHPSGN